MKTTMMDPDQDVNPNFGSMPHIHKNGISDELLSRDVDRLLDPWLEDYNLLPQTSNPNVDDEVALDMNLFPGLTFPDDQLVEHHDHDERLSPAVAQQAEDHQKIPDRQNLTLTSNIWNIPLVSETNEGEDRDSNFINDSNAPQSYDDDLQLDLPSSAHVKSYTSPTLRVPQLIQPVCGDLAANWQVGRPAGTYKNLESIKFTDDIHRKSEHMWPDHHNLSTLPSSGHDGRIGRSVRVPTVHIWSGDMHMMLPEYNPNQASRQVEIKTNVSHIPDVNGKGGDSDDNYHPVHKLAHDVLDIESIQSENYNLKYASSPHQGASTSRPVKRSNAALSNHARSKVALRFNGHVEQYTAYYTPPHMAGTNFAVFLGEYPTEEEAKDAYNLMALMHEGIHEQVFLLPPFTMEKYIPELRQWAGMHQVDLVCYLRLRGRGMLEDGTINFKNVDRRWASKRNTMKYEARVPYNELLEGGSVKRKSTSKAFDTAEEAAAHVDRELVKYKGPEAWTNFPLTSYLKDLPIDFLPLSDHTRQNRNYKRAKQLAKNEALTQSPFPSYTTAD